MEPAIVTKNWHGVPGKPIDAQVKDADHSILPALREQLMNTSEINVVAHLL